MDGRVVVRHPSVFPSQCNSIHIACLNCPVAWHEAFFLPEWQRLQGFFCPGKEWDLWSLLPVIHTDGNDLGQAVGTEEQPGVVRAALGQVEQGVADGRCGFTGNVRPRHTLGQYRHQIGQNFSGCKVEERQTVPLLTGADLPYSSYSPPSGWREWEESVGAHSSHYTLMASPLPYIPTIQVKLHPPYIGQPVICLMHYPLISHVLYWTHQACASCRLPLPF